MPVVSVSLTDVGYEGYKSIPIGRRSRRIDKMLREFALEHHHVQGRSVKEIGEMQVNLKAMIASQNKTIEALEKSLKEAK